MIFLNSLELIGNSQIIKDVKYFIDEAANSDFPVLILGETGVGKELVARLIHKRSKRKEKAFIAVIVANIPENLLESELFGYKKGAFTNAEDNRRGLLEEAEGGTIFLDEIADCSPFIQAKLLRLTETGEIKKLGESKIIRISVRFISSTNKDLSSEIEAGRFRKDFYYRVSFHEIWIPPLRERKEDIPLLVNYIMEVMCKGEKKISEKAWDKLYCHSFPGNIRELEHIIVRAHLRSKGKEIQEQDIVIKPQKMGAKLAVAEELYWQMRSGRKNFWEVVKQPFLERELNRATVKEIINLGLSESRGSFKRLLPLLNLSPNEKEYKRFMKFLSTHKLRQLQISP